MAERDLVTTEQRWRCKRESRCVDALRLGSEHHVGCGISALLQLVLLAAFILCSGEVF